MVGPMYTKKDNRLSGKIKAALAANPWQTAKQLNKTLDRRTNTLLGMMLEEGSVKRRVGSDKRSSYEWALAIKERS